MIINFYRYNGGGSGGGITSGDVITIIESYDYVTSGEVESLITEAIGDIDFSSFLTSADTQYFVTSGDVATQIEGYNYITSGDVPTSNTAFTNDAGYITSADTVDFVTSGDVASQIEGYGYITSADTSDFVTSGDVASQIAAALPDTSSFVTSAVTNEIQEQLDEVERVTSFALNELHDDIPDTSIFVTSGDVANQIENYNYITSADTQNFVSSTTVSTIWKGTQSEYDSTTASGSTANSNTLYIIVSGTTS